MVLENDEFRRFVAAFRDTKQRPHPKPLHFLLLQDLEVYTGVFRYGLGLARDLGRGHHIGRMVAEITNENGGFGGCDSTADALRNGVQMAFLRDQDGHGSHALADRSLAAIGRELIASQDRSFSQGLRQVAH